MNLLLIPWYIMCATLAQTSSLILMLCSSISYLIRYAHSKLIGKEFSKEKIRMDLAIGVLTYVPLLAIVFSAYTAKNGLANYKDPLGCIFGPANATKFMGRQAEEVYGLYLVMKHLGQLAEDEENLNGFFKWLNRRPELTEDILMAPVRAIQQR